MSDLNRTQRRSPLRAIVIIGALTLIAVVVYALTLNPNVFTVLVICIVIVVSIEALTSRPDRP
jgi:Flp pilus assembly protein TadB